MRQCSVWCVLFFLGHLQRSTLSQTTGPHAFDQVYDGMQCEPCGTSFFCSGGGRFACPDHSVTEFSAENNSPSDVEDCVCLPGYLRSHNTCELGGPGPFYFQQGLPMPCPQHKLTYSNGSSLPEQCLCVPGYYHASDGSCEPCAADTYNELHDQTSCVACPERSSHSLMASSAVTDCVCDAGSFRQADAPGECQLCAAGFYKDETGPAACEPCANNTFSNGTGAMVCLACHAQSVSPAQSSQQSQCECVAGYQNAGGDMCAACAVGKSKPEVSHAACQLCAAGTFQNATAQAECLACGGSSTSEPGRAYCECDAGHASAHPGVLVSAPVCAPCVADTYKEGLGPDACDACGLYMRSPVAAVLQAQCLCDEGYFFTGAYDTCVACAAGTFKATVSNGAPETDCVACPEASFSRNASTNVSDCSCNAGFTPGIYQEGCNYCDPGYFKEAPGPELCESCAAGTFNSQTNATRCQDCYAGADSPASSIALEACLCAAGYELNVSAFACQACPAGSFGAEVGAQCAACANGTFTELEARTTCSVCEARSASYATPRVVCECDAGYHGYEAGQGWMVCPTNSSCLRCRACPANYYKELHGDEGCVACQDNSESEPGSVPQSACQCSVGFQQLGEAECAACAPGLFSDTLDAEVCDACAEGRFANVSAMSECHFCWNHSASNANYTGCDCNPGFAPQGDFACASCAADTYKTTRGNTACLTCRADSQSAMASFLVEHCECNAGFFLQGSPEEGECVACCIGTFRPSASNEPCWLCATSLTTEFNGSVSVEKCVCAPGEQFNTDGACEPCPADTFKDVFGREACGACQLCAVDQEVERECNASHPIACVSCPPHSSSLGRQRSGAGACACNAGYEYDGRDCVACPPGRFKEHTNNTLACAECAAGEFTTEVASTACLDCSEHCEGDLETASFVRLECNASRDVVCAPCTVCAPGTLSQPVCGVASSNDRADTVCAVCTPGYFCAGGGGRTLCPGGSESDAGSNSSTDCGCVLGYATTVSTDCTPCGFDTYCRGGQLSACPAHSLTLGVENSIIQDCICLMGFYKVAEAASDPVSSADNFSCALCTPDDYCFNNSLYNCSDERMRSVAGSDEAADCRCVNGFYNNANNTRCLPCELDHYCVDGNIYPCPGDEWTQGQTRQDVCTCRPGLQEDGNVCLPCGVGRYCIGDNYAVLCRAHSSTAGPNAAAYHDCRCDVGFGDGGGQASTCLACAAGSTYKNSIGNYQCENCTRCSGASGLFTSVWCSASSDAVCDACNACANAEEYTHRACADLADAECRSCTLCDFSRELELLPCQTDQNRECRDIGGDLASCAIGSFLGGHTAVSDSYCMPCRYNDTRLNGQSLHAARTNGRVYNDAFSCGVTCLGNSRLRDASRPFLGCVSCEKGNVLLKVFPNNMNQATTCAFTCRPGYERVLMPDGSEDCYIARLLSSPRSEFSHSVSVGDFTRVHDMARLRLTHTSHGFFAVVVGRDAPHDCKRGATGSYCCLARHWRVSTLAHMGLVAVLPEACVGRSGVVGLHGTEVSSGVLELDMSDSLLSEVATCSVRDTVQTCVLVISLVDVITWKVVSVTFALRTTRAVTVAFAPLSGSLAQMLPLSQLEVHVVLLHRQNYSEHIFQVQTIARGTDMLITSRVLGMQQMSLSELRHRLGPCERMTRENGTSVTESPVTQLASGVLSSTVSYWLAGAAVPVFKMLLTLQQVGDSRDVMDVAAVRDVQLLQPVCAPGVLDSNFFVGQVWSIQGMGAEAVSRMTLLGPSAASRTVRGKLDSLLTFIAESTLRDSPPLQMRRILAVHLRGQAAPTALANATTVRVGVRDFTPAFREWCFAAPAVCHLEYISALYKRTNVFVFTSCNATDHENAQKWLQANYGVMRDGGHVAAVCAQQHAMLPFSSKAVMVNTMQYTSRQAGRWNINQDPLAPEIRSRVWVDFEIGKV